MILRCIQYIMNENQLLLKDLLEHYRTIKMKPIDVKDNIYIDFGKEVNDKDPKFKIGGHVRIFKYKNIFAEGYIPNCCYK